MNSDEACVYTNKDSYLIKTEVMEVLLVSTFKVLFRTLLSVFLSYVTVLFHELVISHGWKKKHLDFKFVSIISIPVIYRNYKHKE